MSWNAALGAACIVALLLPVAVIIYHRYYTHRSLAALLVYFTVTAVYNLMDLGFLPVPSSVRTTTGVLNNYLDVPLMLITLLFFRTNRLRQRRIHILIAAFIGYEIVITIIYGFRPASIVYIMGPGIVIILGYAFYLFLRQIKFTIMHGKNSGRTIMLAAILFAYACYGLIYYFYYIARTPYKQDALMLYFISSLIASIIMAIGLHLIRKRMRELESLQTTRRELAVFFGHT